jgi:hypothetical protein
MVKAEAAHSVAHSTRRGKPLLLLIKTIETANDALITAASGSE